MKDQKIGGYRLLKELGHGGMGRVYLAEHLTLGKKVAVKQIRKNAFSREARLRFELEKAVLARLNHPYITPLFDFGMTAEGHPWFAMEYVMGLPLDQYCDQHRLSLEQRLELFVLICHAMAYVHLKGVIHHDLKPGNILVTEENGQAVPKIIDFGIAITGQGVDQTTYAGSPRYMSPEQLGLTSDTGTPVSVDSRSDVYSLGVLLRELLVDRPMSEETTDLTGVLQRHEGAHDPCLLDVWHGYDPKYQHDIADLRQISPRSLAKKLDGELNWMVKKALNRSPTNRYRSSADLAIDLEAFLAGKPISIAPPGPTYLLRSFIRSHRKTAFSFFLTFIVLTITILATNITVINEQRQTALERDRAEEIIGFMEHLFLIPDPEEETGKLTALAMLERSAAGSMMAGSQFSTMLLSTMADSFVGLGDYEQAESLYHRALDQQTPDTEPWLQVKAYNDLARVLHRQGQFLDALKASDQALTRKPMLPDDHSEAVCTLLIRASLLSETGRSDEARALYQESDRHLFRMPPEYQLAGLLGQARFYKERSDFKKAGRLSQKAYVLGSENFGAVHSLTLQAVSLLAEVHVLLGEYTTARNLFDQSLTLRRQLLGNTHPLIAESLTEMARINILAGRYDQAESFLQECLRLCRENPDDLTPITLSALPLVGEIHTIRGEYTQARTIFEQELSIRKQVYGKRHRSIAATYLNLARSLYGDPKQLEAYIFKAHDLLETEDPDSPLMALVQFMIAGHYRYQNRFDQAEEWARKALTGRRALFGEHHALMAEAEFLLADILVQKKEYEQALLLSEKALSFVKKSPETSWLETGSIVKGAALTGLKRYEEARIHLCQGYQKILTLFGEQSIAAYAATNYLAEYYKARGETLPNPPCP